ncbi:MAG TPA: ScyD/ScyE family protein, partial [Acidimicrobiales bacterium]|nr:ScyD/ScyE family protein [Acidimicrobiales bacterium]
TDHIPADAGLPPSIPAEAVPTGVTVASDGTVFVGELKGFPFRPGSSNIWKVDPDAEDALCSTSVADPSCRQVPGTFTAIQDIAVDLSERAMYVYELAAGGVLAFEAGFAAGDFPPAVLLKVTGAGQSTELVAGELSEPGGVAVNDNGVFVTDGLFSEGRLLKIQE